MNDRSLGAFAPPMGESAPDAGSIAVTERDLGRLKEELEARVGSFDLQRVGHIRTLLDQVPAQHRDADYVECLLALGHTYLVDTRPDEAVSVLQSAGLIARGLGDQGLLRKALTYLAVAHVRTTDAGAALEVLAEALEIARRLGDDSDVPVLNNIGLVLIAIGRYREAIDWFRRGADRGLTARAALVRLSGLQCLGNIAFAAAELGKPELGMAAALKAIEHNADPADTRALACRAFAEENLSALLVLEERLVEAREAAERAVAYAERGGGREAAFAAKFAVARVRAWEAPQDDGLRALRELIPVTRSRVRSESASLLRWCVRAYERAGQADTALAYMHELLAWFQQVQSDALRRRLDGLGAVLGDDATHVDLANLDTAKAIELQRAVDRYVDETVSATVRALERAGYDRFRVFRVSRLVELFTRSLAWTLEQVREAGLLARFVDVGMMAMPDELLLKPRGLSNGERRIMTEHTQFGANVLAAAWVTMLQPAVPLARFHHEWWDGSGPWGLAGDAIPVLAQVYSLCDVLDALTHDRPWRKAFTIQQALQTIETEAGTHFDPTLAARFVSFVQNEYWRCADWEEHLKADASDSSYLRVREQIDRLLVGEAA